MKIKEKYFFETKSCKEIPYSEVWKNMDKECLEKIVTVLFKSKSLNLNYQVMYNRDAPYPENLDDLEEIYSKYIERIESLYNKSEKYNCVTAVQEMRHFYCPGCGRAHRDYEYLKPMSSWDEIKKRYKEIITFSKLINFFSLPYYGYKKVFDTFSIITNIMFNPKKREDERFEKGPFGSLCLGCCVPPYEDKYIPFHEFQLAKNGMPLLCCPDCGEIIEIRESANFICAPKNLKYKYLTRRDNWFINNSIPYSYEIFERDEKVILSIIYSHYFPNIQGKLVIKKLTNDRYVFNTKTGQSYKMRTIDMDTKKGVFDGDNTYSVYKEPKINNITYCRNFSFHIPEECIQATLDAICKKQNVPLILAKDIDEYRIKCRNKGTGFNDYEVSNVKIISYVNRYAKLGRDFIKLLYETCDTCYIYHRKQLRKYFEMQTNPQVFIDLMEKNNIKTKGLKKIFAKNPLLLFNYNYLVTIGFKNVDVIMSLLKNEKTIKWFKKIKTVESTNNLRTFVEEYSSIKTEAELAKKVLECDDARYFFDIGNIYTTCLPILNAAPDLSVSRKKTLFKGDIKKIHDTLSDLSYAISSREFYIPYTKEEMKYNVNCGEYSFSLAKTSIELKTVGRTMHICVGSYSNSAFEKRTVIVLMRKTKTNELAACIELSPDYTTMQQAKDYCNGMLSKEKLNPLVSYFKHFGIEYTSSRDGRCNHLEEIHPSESIISVDSITKYKIFDSKEEFKKIYCDEVIFNGEKILLPPRNEDDIYDVWDDDYYQLPF